ncbi:MAG: hypothetical protein K0U93_21300 [Gammaproteobacteria bacterium]|nr:hypothetical protein [Gammaproteobacteria bacterium]
MQYKLVLPFVAMTSLITGCASTGKLEQAFAEQAQELEHLRSQVTKLEAQVHRNHRHSHPAYALRTDVAANSAAIAQTNRKLDPIRFIVSESSVQVVPKQRITLRRTRR